MPTIFRAADLEFKKLEPPLAQFNFHSSPRFAKLAEAEQLQFDIRSLDPGSFSFPYHFHRASEELFHIISGEATLRSPDGFTKVGPGDLLFFPTGPEGAHQFFNHGSVPCVYLDIRTTMGIDVCEYPDSGKINILPAMEVFSADNTIPYYQGEERVREHWPSEILGGAANE